MRVLIADDSPVTRELVRDILSSPNNKDIIWLQEHCTRRVKQ